MSRSSLFETLVGVLIVAVAGAFLAYAYLYGDIDAGRTGYKISAKFGRIDGVSVGADVRIAGVKIGSVAGAELDGETYEARLDMLISDPNVQIPTDSVAKVTLDGLLGGAYVAIEPGAEYEYLEAGGEILFTQGSVDLISLATRAFIDNSAQSDDEGSNSEDDGSSDDNPFDLPEL